ncbi:uncharacterized protein LOC110455194 [Mizuhopecten yessoensis]|uniref:uncharacterized protein LOC110455194 n=1 Tax=Mizuhopecten yessoensis TaxID=6573 RepID=UPI000B45E59E|nr:uncharacterized protein LOC110455194 [Mizuhopecten yessoensis]
MGCSFANFSRYIPCNTSFNIKPSSQICFFHSCLDNVNANLSQYRINPSSVYNELQLIKFRAGIFEHDTDRLTICPNHRFNLRKGWRSSKLCMMKKTLQICNGKRTIERASVSIQQSRAIHGKFGILFPVGALCQKFRSDMVHAIWEEDNSPLWPPVNNISEENAIAAVSEVRGYTFHEVACCELIYHFLKIVVEQYQTCCWESGITDVASDRSNMRILETIEPHIRKSMKGLDNYVAEGAKANAYPVVNSI